MIRFYTLFVFVVCMAMTPFSFTSAQSDWVTVWQNFPPGFNETTHPNYWMRKANSYTGIAYDKWNDVVYVVNPATCGTNPGVPCPRIHVWVADSGTVATQFQHSGASAPPGQLYVDWNLVTGGFSYGGIYNYPIYRIALDDDGRIYSAGVGAPNGALMRIYRWNTPQSSPELLTEYGATLMLGTAFTVAGKQTMVNGQPFDSVRIFVSGGKYVAGYQTNSDVRVFVADPAPAAQYKFRLGVIMQHNQPGSAIAAHGLAPTGASPTAQMYMDSNSREVVLNNQNQMPGALPQYYSMNLNQAIPNTVTGFSGAIRYLRDPIYQMPYLICADGLPTDPDPSVNNENTRARVVRLGTTPLENWPPTPTPQTGNMRFGNIVGDDNYITDVDYKVWIHPDNGNRHLQLFVLMSNNGIACYRTVNPMPVPVEMETFDAIITGAGIELRWQVASEQNNKGFEVYRSYNEGSDWEQIGFVAGRGSSNNAGEYAYTDAITGTHRNAGKVLYRLRQVDFNGAYTWTPALDVFISDTPSSIALNQNYPNPFGAGMGSTSTAISYQIQQSGYVSLKVYNAFGELIAILAEGESGAGIHQATFNSSGLAAGTYICRLEAHGAIVEKRIVLLK